MAIVFRENTQLTESCLLKLSKDNLIGSDIETEENSVVLKTCIRCLSAGARLETNYLMYTQGMYIMNVPFNPTDSNPGGQTLYIPGQSLGHFSFSLKRAQCYDLSQRLHLLRNESKRIINTDFNPSLN